jgi:DNA-binding response OmpR family regulator
MKNKILIVEDEHALSTALSERFSKENFEVLLARDGQEGLRMALSSHPECILLDIIMPVMDGMSMLRELRKDPWGKHVRVIILTNLSNAEDEAKSHIEGVSDYLIKTDWKLEDVVAKVREKTGGDA